MSISPRQILALYFMVFVLPVFNLACFGTVHDTQASGASSEIVLQVYLGTLKNLHTLVIVSSEAKEAGITVLQMIATPL